MATTKPIRERIKTLRARYDRLRQGKEALLRLVDETQLPESVFNSNAIENSTLTLKETERILLNLEISRNVSVREVFEAKNLAQVMEYIRNKGATFDATRETILLLHNMLLGNINERIAGRFRASGEYVRVADHIGAAPERIESMVESLLSEYASNHETYFLDTIAKFHLDFEHIHPFNDGNGRIGRVLINAQLIGYGYPWIIIRDKEKQAYYRSFGEYRDTKKARAMEKIMALALLESLHQRIAYLKGGEIMKLADYAKRSGKSIHALINSARRQTIPAFREKGVWKISP